MKPLSFFAIALTMAVAACSASHDARVVPGATKSASLHVRHLQNDLRRPLDNLGGAPTFRADMAMYDAPLIGASAANAQFNAGLLGVDAIDGNGDSWQLIGYDKPVVVNLLALQNTSFALGGGSLPAGTYPAVQLLLDPSTTSVTYNGKVYPVRIVDPNHPWWDTTQTIEAVSVPLALSGKGSETVAATLDFNVFQSADLRDDGFVYLTPTVAGGIGQPTIAGAVANSAGSPVANATIIATDASGTVANTTITGADGTFHLRGISAGAYTISVANTFTTNAGVTVSAAGADPGAAPSANVIVGPNGTINVATLID